jgi:hypothetical protein
MTDLRSDLPVPLSKARQRTVDVLCKHFAEDHLTVEEFETRLDHAYAADSLERLGEILAGLPSLDSPADDAALPVHTVERVPAEQVSSRGFQVAIMGGSDRRGAWTPPRHLYTVALMGGAGLDFREARLPPGVTEVTVVALMGGVDIIVPPGLGVRTQGACFLGGFDALDQVSADPSPDAPFLKINGLACMGGVEVKVMLPGETPRDARRRLKEQRRRLARRRAKHLPPDE